MNIDNVQIKTTPPRRGRPPKNRMNGSDTKELLIRAGLEVLTEKGFVSAGIDEILAKVQVPKGSFYHYFKSKEAFGLVLIDQYASYFAHKLDVHFKNTSLSPMSRLHAFIDDAAAGMERYEYKRGCLVGNLGQEMNALPISFRERLMHVLKDWEVRTAECLALAKDVGQINPNADCAALARIFWIGWEGAVTRAKLERDAAPLMEFAQYFFRAC